VNVSHLEAIGYRQDQLNKIFDAVPSGPIDLLINSGARQYDIHNRTIFNDTAWKGYFPIGQPLNAIASNIHSSFRKRFFRQNGTILGITSDSDFFIEARNTLEEVTLSAPKGTLRAGRYLLLRYTDLPWRAFYDLIKVINEKLLIGKVFTGLPYPNGLEVFTFPMVREYSFDEMTVDDHRVLYQGVAISPDSDLLKGTWNMSVIANSNHRSDVARLTFDVKPDGKLEGRYLLMSTIQGESRLEMTPDQLQMTDFTPLHDEIRALDSNYMLGKWITSERVPFGPFSVGLLQLEPADGGQSRFGFYYTLKRTDPEQPSPRSLLEKIIGRNLGVGLTFQEQMDGSFYPGDQDSSPGHLRNLKPEEGKKIQFNVTMTIADLDKFVGNNEHRAELTGSIQLEQFHGDSNVSSPLDTGSFFNYLIANPASQEHEMRYHIRFQHQGTQFVLQGTKFIQKDGKGDFAEILEDYTTLFVQIKDESTGVIQGTALMKFRTFESLAAIQSMAQFGISFTVMGTDDPVVKAAALAKFNAMTTKFILEEYDPLSL
jgi:hypothetical protein